MVKGRKHYGVVLIQRLLRLAEEYCPNFTKEYVESSPQYQKLSARHEASESQARTLQATVQAQKRTLEEEARDHTSLNLQYQDSVRTARQLAQELSLAQSQRDIATRRAQELEELVYGIEKVLLPLPSIEKGERTLPEVALELKKLAVAQGRRRGLLTTFFEYVKRIYGDKGKPKSSSQPASD